MSKGLSKIQRVALGVLGGAVQCRVYALGSGCFGTNELVEELVAHGILPDDRPQRQLLAVVRRACDSMQRRGLVTSSYARDEQRHRTVEWSARCCLWPRDTAR